MKHAQKENTALITGASSGIGLALARVLAREGYSLILVARRKEKLEQIARELETLAGQKMYVIAKDLSKPESPKEIFEQVQTLRFSIDLLVNNAGFGDYGNFEKSNLEKQTNMIDLNIRSLTALTHVFLPMLKQQKASTILNVASVVSFFPGPAMSVYCATKAYVLSFSEALSQELKQTNVSVSTLCPGATATEFGARVTEKSDEDFFDTEKIMTAEQVAEIAYQGIQKKQTIIIPGGKNKLFAFLPRLFPRSWVRYMAQKSLS